MKPKPKLAESSDDVWTHPGAYIEALARKRTHRRSHAQRRRTQPESPRLLLSTLPFLALIGLMAILVIAIAVIAFPGSQPHPKQQIAAKEQGVAERGWFQEAQKEMHR